MKKKEILLFVIFILLSAASAYSDDLSQARVLFHQGNMSYGDEKSEEAIADYEQALSLGFESGPLYYNLGNAYFKHGSLGKAILNYSRAERLMPNDADLKANLNYAKSLIKGGMIPSQRNWPARIYLGLADSFNLNGITLLSEILYFALAILIILTMLARRAPKTLLYANGVLFILLAIALSIFITQFNSTIIRKEAIVIARESDSKFEPFSDGTTFFTLSEGEKVVVVATKGDWVKIRRDDGKQAWVKRSGIELL